MLQAAIERKFMVIGEALVQLAKIDSYTAESLTDFAQIVGFRNRLVQGYSDIDARAVWQIVAEDLSKLIAEIDKLLS